jgi:FixJ family two-component response regulator
MQINRWLRHNADRTLSSPPQGYPFHLARIRPVKHPFVAIVDDDEALCLSLVDLMLSVGHRAEAFTSAETLLTSRNLLLFDCVVADVHMPGMDGLKLARKLTEQGRGTPVILITALPDKHLSDEAISVGAKCLLRKPFQTKALLDCIEKHQ